MKMKYKQIILALIASLAAGHAAANVTAAEVLAAPLTSKTWISGASAPTYVAYAGWALGCDAGTQRVFTTNAVSGTVAKPGSIGNSAPVSCLYRHAATSDETHQTQTCQQHGVGICFRYRGHDW